MLQAVIEAVTNREDWIDQIEVRDETDELIDLTDAVIVFSVRDKSSKQNLLVAKTADGSITIVTLGIFEVNFPESQMRGMDASKAYEVGCTIQIDGRTRQFLIGTVSILDGITP